MNTAMQRLARSLAIAAMPVATICLFVSMTIYLGNVAEFSSDLPSQLIFVLPYAISLVVAIGLAGFILSEAGRARYEALLCALTVLVWFQGNILVWNYGVLNGNHIDWMEGAWRGALDASIWAAVTGLAIFAWQRAGRGLLIAATAACAIQTLSAAITVIANPQVLQAKDVEANVEGRASVMRFSSNKNIVHILMDGFQSDIFARIVTDTAEHDFKADLRGFTYFDQHLGAYPYTQLTVPAMLSGKLFHNEEPVQSFIDKTMRGATITNSAIADGYEVDIVAPTSLRNVYVQGNYSNAYSISASGHVGASDYVRVDAAKLMDLALFRVVPHFAKALIHRDELWVFQASSQMNAYLQMQYFSDLAFLDELATEMSADRDVPVYKMIHVMLSHNPIVGNEDCEFDGRKSETTSVTTHARCGLLAVAAVLERMKELDIYDSSLIVLMGDHGAWARIQDFVVLGGVDGLTVAMATPVLAVKPPNSSNEFQYSSAPSSIIDVPATIADIAGFDPIFGGESVFSLAPGAARERRHLVYGYGINPNVEGYLNPMRELIVNGNPYKAESWQSGQRYLPADEE
jgi:hypothetical protein